MHMEKITALTDAAPPSDRVRDPAMLRGTFGRFASGVTVVTCADGGGAHGMTANSFISVSLDPARALISVKNSAKMHALLMANDAFGLSVLGADQAMISAHFSGREQTGFIPSFDHISGVPLIAGAIAWMLCRRNRVVEIGDHSLFIGDLIDCDHRTAGEPLLFFGGRYATLAARGAA